MSGRVVSADKWLKKLIILYADWQKKFRNRRSLRRENQS